VKKSRAVHRTHIALMLEAASTAETSVNFTKLHGAASHKTVICENIYLAKVTAIQYFIFFRIYCRVLKFFLVILLAVRLMLKILRRRVTAGPKDDI
jgi:hypothetical protein